jgi:hypothetical protein
MALDKHIREKNEVDIARREEEKAFLKQQNDNLEKFLKGIDNSAKH